MYYPMTTSLQVEAHDAWLAEMQKEPSPRTGKTARSAGREHPLGAVRRLAGLHRAEAADIPGGPCGQRPGQPNLAHRTGIVAWRPWLTPSSMMSRQPRPPPSSCTYLRDGSLSTAPFPPQSTRCQRFRNVLAPRICYAGCILGGGQRWDAHQEIPREELTIYPTCCGCGRKAAKMR